MDIVLYNRSSQPQLLAQTTQFLFPVETVLATLEVKTTLTADAIIDYSEKRDKMAHLECGSGHLPPFGLFAYRFGGSDYMRALELSTLSPLPPFACVIEPGFISDPTLETSAGFTPLHAVDESGERTEGTWQRPEGHDTNVIVNGINYPVFMMGQYSGEKYVGEPGRALLLFCTALLPHMSDSTEFTWMSQYVSPIFRELLPASN